RALVPGLLRGRRRRVGRGPGLAVRRPALVPAGGRRALPRGRLRGPERAAGRAHRRRPLGHAAPTAERYARPGAGGRRALLRAGRGAAAGGRAGPARDRAAAALAAGGRRLAALPAL